MKTVVVIGGGETFDSYEDFLTHLREVKRVDVDRLSYKGWKDTLQERLGEGFRVVRPSMPNKQYAQYDAWSAWFERVMDLIEGPVTLIGHSLGGMFLLKYLSEHKLPHEIEGLHCVAAPYAIGGQRKPIKEFLLPDDLSSASKQCNDIHLYHSEDDPVVPVSELDELVKRLPDATVHRLDGLQHVNGETFVELEEVLSQR